MLGSYPGLLGQDQNADVPHIFPCGELPDEVPNQTIDVSHTENGLLVPVQQGQLSVINKTKKQATLEFYSEDVKAWRLQLKSITSADKETLDEETEERLENERKLFHSRIQAFTACMHVIQGTSLILTCNRTVNNKTFLGVYYLLRNQERTRAHRCVSGIELNVESLSEKAGFLKA